jgi:transposase
MFFTLTARMRAVRWYLTRGKLLDFFARHPRCVVALEACGGAHYLARELRAMGHEVRLIPPAYVNPFVKRHKSDAVDAEAIWEAAQRPSMRFVAVKSEEQQAAAGRIWLGCAQGCGSPRYAGGPDRGR